VVEGDPLRTFRQDHSLSRGPLWRPGDPPLGLYVHVPFCRSICTYCAFAKGEYDPVLAEAWLEGLSREIAARRGTLWEGRPRLDTLFLGGGTPTSLTGAQWRRLGEILFSGFVLAPGAEFTSEANPESFTPEIAAAMREVGVNRVSLGVQTLDAEELDRLGRPHDAAAAVRAVAIARRTGFSSVSLDLMYGLPEQAAARFAASLAGILELAPDHLSAYCLGLEPGTELAQAVSGGRLPRPDDEAARSMHEHLVGAAAQAGLDQYEISNFARPGHACRHNLRYWERRDFLALGPSAHGLLANHRWANPAPLDRWREACDGGGAVVREVPAAEARFEWVFLHLRLTRGFSERAFATAWGLSLDAAYGPVVERLCRGGMLAREGGRLTLTPDAQFVSDAVFSEFAP
jgi:oxygen-independent coproporphyrinogen-3 oxidase